MIQEEKNYVNNQLAVRQCGFDGNSIAVKGDGVAATIAVQQATVTSSIIWWGKNLATSECAIM